MKNGGTAFLSGAFNSISETEAVIIGENGRITIGPVFWKPSKAGC